MDIKSRLTKKDITLKELLIVSFDYYRKKDDKEYRAEVDVVNARLSRRQNFSYNRSKRQWEQTGRDVKFTFTVKTDPISYKRTDKLKYHYYPVVFLIHDVSLGINSSFKWRTGSLRKPVSIKKSKKGQTKKKLQEQDIKNGVQLQFFFELEWILRKYNLLYERNWAAYPPRKTNPSLFPFFDKHAYYIATKILLPLMTTTKRFRLNEIWKNE